MTKNNKKFSFGIIIVLFPILILVGKLIRYTMMKSILVDVGIGHNWIQFFSNNMNVKEILSYTIAGDQNGLAILFFKYTNIFHLKTYIDFEIYISIILNFLLIVMFFKCKNKITVIQLIFIVVSIIVLNLFDFCLSKEPLQLIIFAFIYYVLINNNMKHKELMVASIILVSSIIFKKYYILIVIFGYEAKLILKYFSNKKATKKNILILLFITASTYIIILLVAKYLANDYYTELIRVRTRTSNANTNISSIFDSTNLVLFGINYLITIIRLLFPIELLSFGPKYILYIAYQLIITISVGYTLIKFKKNSDIQKIAIYIYIGFILTSATFEPDFGSWIRHEATLFPIMLIINNIAKSKQLKDKKVI